jgi:hypothetical protein
LIFFEDCEVESTSSLIPSLMLSLTKSSDTEREEVDSDVEERGSLSVELALP